MGEATPSTAPSAQGTCLYFWFHPGRGEKLDGESAGLWRESGLLLPRMAQHHPLCMPPGPDSGGHIRYWDSSAEYFGRELEIAITVPSQRTGFLSKLSHLLTGKFWTTHITTAPSPEPQVPPRNSNSVLRIPQEPHPNFTRRIITPRRKQHRGGCEAG